MRGDLNCKPFSLIPPCKVPLDTAATYFGVSPQKGKSKFTFFDYRQKISPCFAAKVKSIYCLCLFPWSLISPLKITTDHGEHGKSGGLAIAPLSSGF